jgi:hypothetical protein
LSLHGRKTGEARSLLAFEAPKLRHFDEQSESGDRRDGGDREKNLEAARELNVVVDKLFDSGVDLVDFHVDLDETLLVLLFEPRKRDRLGAVSCGGEVLNEWGSGQMQLFQLGDELADAGTERQIENLAHAREHGGVGSVGFDELAGGLGEAARLARIDLGDGDTDCIQRALKHAMVWTCRVEQEALHRRCGEPFDQGLERARAYLGCGHSQNIRRSFPPTFP